MAKKTTKARVEKSAPPQLLTGGNPQIAKGYGDAPIEEYLAAMPGWKQAVGRRLDAIITRTLPRVQKAVKWNTPLYGIEPDRYCVAFNCCTKYVKVTFFRGQSLTPIPPVESKQQEVRYWHIFEGEELDEKQFAAWVKQAGKLEGVKL